MNISRTTVVILLGAFALVAQVQASTATPLGAVLVQGSTAYTAPRLFPAYRDALGRPLTPEAARTIGRALADQYVRDGFVRPDIAADETLAGSGVLRLQVHEARITRVVIEGESGRHAPALQDIAARLQSATPLRSDAVPSALREMRALAGLTLSASSRADPARRHGFELVVHARYKPVDGVVRVNNRGTRETGPLFVLGQLYANGLLGGRERLGLLYAASAEASEFLGGGLLLDAPLGHGTTRASLLLFGSRTAPHERPTDLDYRYLRNRALARISHPLASRGVTLTLTAAMEASDLRIDREAQRIREDRLRVLETGLRSGWRSANGVQLATSTVLRKGLAGLGAGLDAPGLVDDPRRADFMLGQLQATLSRRVSAAWNARLDAFAQHSEHVLPDSERFKIGGDRLGRGFEVAEIVGDSGVGAKAELRRDLLNAGAVGRLAAYGFYDIGVAWKRHQPGSESAATTGLGLALGGGALTGYLEVAAPVSGADIEGRNQASLFAEVSWRF